MLHPNCFHAIAHARPLPLFAGITGACMYFGCQTMLAFAGSGPSSIYRRSGADIAPARRANDAKLKRRKNIPAAGPSRPQQGCSNVRDPAYACDLAAAMSRRHFSVN